MTSPTFTLVRQYPCRPGAPAVQLLHADLYRLDHLAEVADLALPELLEEDAIALVEWGDVGAPVLGDSALEVTLRPEGAPDGGGAERRAITLAGRGPAWADRRDAVARAVVP